MLTWHGRQGLQLEGNPQGGHLVSLKEWRLPAYHAYHALLNYLCYLARFELCIVIVIQQCGAPHFQFLCSHFCLIHSSLVAVKCGMSWQEGCDVTAVHTAHRPRLIAAAVLQLDTVHSSAAPRLALSAARLLLIIRSLPALPILGARGEKSWLSECGRLHCQLCKYTTTTCTEPCPAQPSIVTWLQESASERLPKPTSHKLCWFEIKLSVRGQKTEELCLCVLKVYFHF